MNEGQKNALKATGTAAAGGAAGAVTYATIGGLGLAVGGTAVGITLGPFICIGAGLGLTGYGVYWLGKQIGRSTVLAPLTSTTELGPTAPHPEPKT
jgi:hypothetical protein